MSHQRKNWIDFVKAICITLVVIGHSPQGLPGILVIFIYSFHVPAFIIVSGFLLSRTLTEGRITSVVKFNILPFLRLYAFFSFLTIPIYYLLHALNANKFKAPPSLADSLLSVAYGALPFEIQMLNRPLWYFTFLCSSLLIAWIILRLTRRLPSGFDLLLSSLAASIVLYVNLPILPWYILQAPLGATFVILGVRAKQWMPFIESAISKMPAWRSLFITLAVGLFTIFLSELNGKVNIGRVEFGNIPALIIVTAILGTLSLSCLGMILQPRNIYRRLSSHTLVIFCTHIFFMKFVLSFLGEYSPVFNTCLVIMWDLIVVWICLRLSEWVMPWITRYVILKG